MTPAERLALVPRDLEANVRFRKALLERARTDPVLRAGLMEACRLDILFWVNVFVIQVDPKQKGDRGRPGPFVTYPFQEPALLKMLGWVERGRDGLIEKSRQMGASWMLIMLFAWLWLFRPWQTFLFISRNEYAVESPDPNSLFWKLDFILAHLPDWMVPPGWRDGKGRRKRFFGNGRTNSSIFGEASTGSANVGGNTTAMGIDEFSQIKEGYEVLHRTSDSTQCRIFNSTHLGLDTAFYELSRRVDLDKLVLHWSEHPVYGAGAYRVRGRKVVPLDPAYEYPADFQFVMDGTPTGGPFPGLRSPWYDEQCRRKGSARAIAMDLDINPSGSVAQVFDALLVRDLQAEYCRRPFFRGVVNYDPDTAREGKLVARENGPLSLWLHPGPAGTAPFAPWVIAGDISTGQGASPSVLSILDRSTGEKAGEYVSNEIDPHDLGTLAVSLCWLFRDQQGQPAKLVWESNGGTGLAFGRRVLELGFRNIYWRTQEGLSAQPTDIPGWYSTPRGKQSLLEEYEVALRTRKFLNHSWDALEECLAFRYNASGNVEHSGEQSKNSPADARFNHGDRVIADALAWMVARGSPAKTQTVEPKAPPHPGSLAGRRAIYERERVEAEEAWV